ncbi:MAG: DnaA N-terminal domain-containing protein, partial [Actinomycetota bacterium]
MTNDTDTPPANADAANNSESSRAAAVIEPSNGLWERAAAVLRQQVSEAVWFSTFSDIIVERDTPGKVGGTMSLTLRVPNAFVRDRVLTRYMSLVRDALNEAGGSAHELHVDVRQVAANPVQAAPNTPLTAPHTGVPSAPA